MNASGTQFDQSTQLACRIAVVLDAAQSVSVGAKHVRENEGVRGIVFAAGGTVAVAGALGAFGVDAEDFVALVDQPGEQGPVVHLHRDAHVLGVRFVLGDSVGDVLEACRIVGDLQMLDHLSVCVHKYQIVLASGPVDADDSHVCSLS